MAQFLQQLLNGISLGAIYALIALGYTMVYGVLRFINFAHSDVFMVGAFIGFYAGKLVPEKTIWGGLVVLFAAMLGCALLGMIIERLAYRPLRNAATLNVLITAIGVSLLLEYTGQVFFGAAPRTFPSVFPEKTFQAGSVVISTNQLIVIVVAVLLMIGLQLIVHAEQRLSEDHRTLKLIRGPSQIQRLFSLSGLEPRFRFIAPGET